MITPKSLISFLSEAAESEAAQQAKEMGLTSAGYGNWRDRSGSVVARTVDGKLVMIGNKADPMARPEAPEEEMPPEEEEAPQFVEPDPDLVEKIAKGLSGGRYNIASAQRKKELQAAARQTLINKQIQDSQMQADAEAQAAAQNPPEPTPEELAQQQADMELQQQNAVMDTELKAQSVENGKLDLQMKKDQMKQQKEAEKEAKAMDKLAKKAQSQKDPGSMAQRMANDAEYEAQVAKDGEEALLDVQTEPDVAPATAPKQNTKTLGKVATKTQKTKTLGKVATKTQKTKTVQPKTEKVVNKVNQDAMVAAETAEEDMPPELAKLINEIQKETNSEYENDDAPVSRDPSRRIMVSNPRIQKLYDMGYDFHEKETQQYYKKEGAKRGLERVDEITSVVTDPSYKEMASDMGTLADFAFSKPEKDERFKMLSKIGKPTWEELEAARRNPERFSGDIDDAKNSSRPMRGQYSDKDIDSMWNSMISGKNGKVIKSKARLFAESGWGRRANEYIALYKDKYGKDWEEMYLDRGKKMFKIYMEQGGRDGWVGDEKTSPMPMGMYQADHIVDAEGGEEFWRDYAKTKGMNPDDWYFIADDPEHNIILTRSQVNEQTKKGNTIEDFKKNLDKFYKSGSEKDREKHYSQFTKTFGKAITRDLRDEYHNAVVSELTSMIRDGSLTAKDYGEIIKNYKKGRSEILGTPEGTGNFSEQYSSLGNSAMDLNNSTDVFRALGDSLKNAYGGSNFGIYADEAIRKQKKKQQMGWYGFGLSTSPSNAARTDKEGEYQQYSLNHPALDYYKDAMYQLSLTGPEGYEKANNLHTVANLMGNVLSSGGTIGTKDWVNTVKSLAQYALDSNPNSQSNFDMDGESQAHAMELAKRVGSNYLPDHKRLSEDNVIPVRNTTGVDEMFGVGFQANKVKSVRDFIVSLSEVPGLDNILGNSTIFGSQLLEDTSPSPLQYVIMERFQNKRRNEI